MHQAQDLQEKINILDDCRQSEFKNKEALENRFSRYSALKKIIEELNQDLSIEKITDNLVSAAFSVIAGNKGTCILYLVDPQTKLSLSLFKVKKEDEGLVLKAKEGDIFDYWALRHSSPLLIEDVKKDFRFDLEKLRTENYTRPIASLISAPLISEHKFLGLLRLDSQQASFYSQDDLRFLVTISDIGAVALENGQLFKKTQDLAIHDELTSFYTKGFFMERLKEECARARRSSSGALSLFMLDIDFFKNYNDRFGHTAGDIVLKRLSEAITDALKGLNPLLISRFGGEEFCILFLGLGEERSSSTAELLRQRIEETKFSLRRHESNITVSIGIANLSPEISDEFEFISRADKAMYEAKKKGRNRVIIWQKQ
ncbi:MAG TPA: sensor domain-containing diguanylate cyclase [Candidatus Omnitrophota bacterium]|nr:sensor domain-containing diguanylate cyclase [Candidatus Omnitrophota bacterium]